MLAAIRERAQGERRWPRSGVGCCARAGCSTSRPVSEGLAAIARVITESPALRMREQQVFERLHRGARRTCSPVRREPRPTRSSPGSRPTRCSGCTAHSSTTRGARILAGARNPELARDLRARAEEARAMLAAGLATYAVRGRSAD